MSDFDDFLADLRRAAPAVVQRLEDDGEQVEPDLEIPVSWMGSVGRALADTFPGLGEAERRAAFGVVEHHLARGSELMATALTTGLLESLVHQVSRGRVVGAELAEHLGPQSRQFVDAYDQFTLGRSSLS